MKIVSLLLKAGADPNIVDKVCQYVYVIPPFGVVLLVYPPDYPRAHSARGGRADKPQHHDKRWNKNYVYYR